MSTKDLLRSFRTARFANPAEVEKFIEDAGELDLADAQQVYALLLDRRLVEEGRPHVFRCALFKRLVTNSPHRELFVTLIRSVRSADPAVRNMLLEVLPIVNSVAGHRDMVGLFRVNDLEVRNFAKTLAVKIGGKTAFGLLVELCRQPDFPGRIEAAEACVMMAGYHAIPALRAVLEAGTSEEKLTALTMLGDVEIITKNRQGALEAISVALDDISEEVSIAAITSFGLMAEEDDFFRYVIPQLDAANLTVVQAVIKAMSRYLSPRVLSLLKEQLLLGPKSIRLAVLDTLEGMNHEDVLPVVAEALNHKQIAVRLRAAQVLENLATEGTIDIARTIVWLLRSRDVDVKRIAADIARKVGDPDGKLWPQLLRFLRDEDWWVRERITDALVELAGTNLTRHVIGFLQDDSAVVRRYGVEMLMRLKDPAGLGALVRTVSSDDDWWVRERAIEAIGVLKDKRAVPYIIDFMGKEAELELVCIETLRNIGDATAAPHVASRLDLDDVDVTVEALRCLDELNDTEQAPRILPFAEHEDFRVRSLARELLGRWNIEAQFQDWAGDGSAKMNTLDRLLWATAKANGDDLLLAAGRQPYIKRLGDMVPLVKNVFTDDQVRSLIYPNLSQAQIRALEDEMTDVDFSYEVKSAGLRFRVNVLQEHGGLAAVFRVVKNVIPAFEELGMPPLIGDFGDMKNGLVLVGGPTGSGKSTTLAAIIDHINRRYRKHIITLEDPIEVIHTPKSSLINQREMGTHSASFVRALRSTLREDPDVILVGEMRDLATISFAISAAETGHLVFGTVHTSSADTTVDRIINAFPYGQQPQVRSILSSSLRAVVCQYLVPRRDGRGRIPAVEIMLNTEAIANLIRKGKTYQIANVVATSREHGMQSMDLDLMRLYRAGIISSEDGYMRAVNKKEFEAGVVEHESGGASSRAAEMLSGGSAPAVVAGQGE